MKIFIFITLFLSTPLCLAQAPVTASATTLGVSECSSTFVTHQLDHITKTRGNEVTFYDSNGSGVAVGDLDNDNDIDIVLANLKDKNNIFWNEGNLSFRKEELPYGDSRAAAIVDVNGDGWNDIVFTQNLGTPIYFRNQESAFSQEDLPGVDKLAYTMTWGDLDADGDLDLVTASYDSLLEKELKDTFLFSNGAGVIVYTNTPDGFIAKRLAEKSQALAITLFDIDNDGKQDILVGNDFEVPDYYYLNRTGSSSSPQSESKGLQPLVAANDAEWIETKPFSRYTKNTMSFDVADIDNDGLNELYATDMKPNFNDLSELAIWMELMNKGFYKQVRSSPQRPENVLQKRTGEGFQNIAYDVKLDATGWSWAGEFGDLDNDGLQDLYVVNGMIAKDVFDFLPNYELVEKNRVFHNLGSNNFENVDWGLASTASGRGMTMADLDNDGDLDIVVNNLESPSVIFENQLCGGDGLEVDLTWNSSNSGAIGATLKLTTSAGTFMRDIRTTSGYLSGEASRVHFGIPKDATLNGLEILWPDGQTSSITDLQTNTLLSVTRKELP
jgi:enediyne biosynthesis protein E4